MKIKHQLSIATLLMAGVFVTGCSQQSAGGSQVSGSSQAAGSSQVAGSSQAAGSQQVAGSSQSQVEGASQVSGSQQQVEAAVPVVTAPAPAPAPKMMPKPRMQPKPRMMPKPRPRVNRWAHTHPAVPRCTKSVRHTHKYNQARHSHKYSCQGMRPAPRRVAKPRAQAPQVDVRALQQKLKAKGFYKGPIDGIVGPGTRSALQRFMKR